MLRKSWSLSILVSLLVLTFGLLAMAQTNTGGPAAVPQEIAPSPQGNVAPASIVFDLSPGTGAPPATLGGFTMTPVPFPGAPACTGIDPPLPTPGGGGIGVSPVDSSGHRCIGSGWASWSHGYSGDVYYTGGATSQSVTPPAGTTAVYFYVEPNPFEVHNFEVVADGVSSGIFSADGSGGATYVGVYNTSGTVNNITINCDVDFASGEYGWSGGGGCTGAIGGKVIDARTLKPLPRAFVLAIKLPDKEKAFAVTDGNGVYKITDLMPATYFVLCFKKGYNFAFAFPVKVECDKTTVVDFKLAPALE